MSTHIDPSTRRMLADQIYDAVFELLMDGGLSAGEPVGIDALARRFDVSQTPVREALARLESTGLVHRVALRGYRVAPMTTPEEIDRLMVARLVFEPVLAAMAAPRLEAATLAALQTAVDDLRAAPVGPSFHQFRQYWEADERFHTIVAAAAGNEFLEGAFLALGGQIKRFRLFGGTGVTDSDHCVAEHERVLRALRTGDADEARAAMTAHITDARDRALEAARTDTTEHAPTTEELP